MESNAKAVPVSWRLAGLWPPWPLGDSPLPRLPCPSSTRLGLHDCRHVLSTPPRLAHTSLVFMDGGQDHVVAVAIICFLLILFRCCYRVACPCKIHSSCPRKWHQDDVWMALAVLPLVGRSVCVALYNSLMHKRDPTPADYSLALKLLIPARLNYALV